MGNIRFSACILELFIAMGNIFLIKKRRNPFMLEFLRRDENTKSVNVYNIPY